MKQITCPVQGCGKRLFDSDKPIYVALLSKSNETKADIILKHHACGNCIAVRFKKNSVPEYRIPEGTEVQ